MKEKSIFLQSCQKNCTPRPAVWLMRQAGRHLPEYNALRAQHDFLEMLTKEELIVEVSLQPWRRYQMDAVIVFSDILLLPMVMGMELMFLEPHHLSVGPKGQWPKAMGQVVGEGQGPKFKKLIETEKDLESLKSLKPKKDIPFLLGALKKIKKTVGDGAALIGFAGAPWTVASYMGTFPYVIRKSDNRGERPLLHRLTQETIVYLQAQIDAGVDAIQIFDSWGGSLKTEEYWEWSGRYIKEVITALKPAGVPIILYIKDSRHLLTEMMATGCDVISVGWETPLEEAKKLAQGKVAIQGNFNPHILMQSSPVEIAAATQKMLATMKDYPGYIANLGHGVLPKTPVENVKAFVKTVKQYK